MVISESYREQQRKMHEMPRGYGGVNVNAMGPTTLRFINEIGAQCVLDYGAGKGHLGEYLFRRGYKGDYRPYDPAVPYWADSPQPSEFVVCADVLEHIEPEYLESVLEDLKRVTLRRGLFSVCLRAAKKTLPDGRNAHLIVESPEWWRERIARHFEILSEHTMVGEKDRLPLNKVYQVGPLP